MPDSTPTARSLLALELIQDRPGITAEELARRLGVSDRAVRRYVGILRDAGVPVQATTGRYGGYRLGRGFRVPPLMFSTGEAVALVMSVVEAGHAASDPDTAVGSALSKIIRVLPAPVAGAAAALRGVYSREPTATPDPEITARLVQACGAHRRATVVYGPRERRFEVDPWAVCIRHGRWYLLCWSRTADAQRVLRVDRMHAVHVGEAGFEPPADLDPLTTLAGHLAEGWRYQVELLIDAPPEQVERWVPRSLGRLDPVGTTQTRLVGSTDEPDWYAARLWTIQVPFHVVHPPELSTALRALAERLLRAAGPPPDGYSAAAAST